MTIYAWDDIPKEYNWIATDLYGKTVCFKTKPIKFHGKWITGKLHAKIMVVNLGFIDVFWSDSLEKRPSTKKHIQLELF